MIIVPFLVPKCRDHLLPMADIVTPNLKEASALLGGQQLETVADMRSAAKLLHDMGPRLVLRKFIEYLVLCCLVDLFISYLLTLLVLINVLYPQLDQAVGLVGPSNGPLSSQG